jgi:mono/diheme cytochrome c family protein
MLVDIPFRQPPGEPGQPIEVQSSAITFSRMAGSVLLLIVAAFLNVGRAQTAQPTNKSENRNASQNSDRGKYIVEDIAICGQCHTPRDSHGAPDRSRWLEGAPVWLKSAEPVENWPLQAPRIAGALPGTDAEMVTLLTTGIWRGGYLRPPMPQFRMSQQDAAAVIVYLKAVKPEPK